MDEWRLPYFVVEKLRLGRLEITSAMVGDPLLKRMEVRMPWVEGASDVALRRSREKFHMGF